MNRIVTGRDDAHLIEIILGLIAIGVVVLSLGPLSLYRMEISSYHAAFI
jgi:hypothetical protein